MASASAVLAARNSCHAGLVGTRETLARHGDKPRAVASPCSGEKRTVVTHRFRGIIPRIMRRGRTVYGVSIAAALVLMLAGCGGGWNVYETDVQQYVHGEQCYKAWSPDSDQVAICPSGCYIEGPAFGGGTRWYLPEETPLKNARQLCTGARKALHDTGYL